MKHAKIGFWLAFIGLVMTTSAIVKMAWGQDVIVIHNGPDAEPQVYVRVEDYPLEPQVNVTWYGPDREPTTTVNGEPVDYYIPPEIIIVDNGWDREPQVWFGDVLLDSDEALMLMIEIVTETYDWSS